MCTTSCEQISTSCAVRRVCFTRQSMFPSWAVVVSCFQEWRATQKENFGSPWNKTSSRRTPSYHREGLQKRSQDYLRAACILSTDSTIFAEINIVGLSEKNFAIMGAYLSSLKANPDTQKRLNRAKRIVKTAQWLLGNGLWICSTSAIVLLAPPLAQ